MGRCSLRMPDEFLLTISNLGDKTDEIIPRVLEAGGEVVVSKVRSNLVAAVGKDTKHESRSTGELLGALGVTPALQDKDGNHNIKVGFSEPRKDGGSNAKLANILEYGKHGQPPKPFLKPAKSASKKACMDAMKAALDREMGEI